MIGKEIGPYRITEKIGQGGMGVVYKGLHVKLEQEVAVKVLAPEFSQDPAMRERFVREAKIQAKISHPNVVNVLNYVEDHGNLFLVMEYIRGETLESRLKRTGRVSDPVGVCISVLTALDFMHSRGIIHRDIKPGNVMFLEDGSVKVMDFGIAKVAGEKGQTKTGMRLGTLWYMSPEQIKGEDASVSSDLYSVGVTLYQMATNRVPFGGDSEYKIMKAHLEEKPIPPWEINANVSREVGSIILKAIAKDKKDRYRSAREFADDLRALDARKSAPLEISPAVSLLDKINLPRFFSRINLERFFSPIARLDRKYLLIALLCLGVVLIFVGLFLSVRHKEESVFPVTKTLPTVPTTSPARQPAAVSEPPAGPVPVEQLAKPADEATTEKKETPVKKKKTGSGRAKRSGGRSHDDSEGTKWEISK